MARRAIFSNLLLFLGGFVGSVSSIYVKKECLESGGGFQPHYPNWSAGTKADSVLISNDISDPWYCRPERIGADDKSRFR